MDTCPDHDCRIIRPDRIPAACLVCIAEEAVGRRPLAPWFAAQPDAIQAIDFLDWVRDVGLDCAPGGRWEGADYDRRLAKEIKREPLSTVCHWIEERGAEDFSGTKLCENDDCRDGYIHGEFGIRCLDCRGTGRLDAPLRLWLDDVRPAPPGWARAFDAAQARAFFGTGLVVEASLDFDLGPGRPTGLDLARWLDEAIERDRVPMPRRLVVHSEHPTAGPELEAVLAGIVAQRGGELRVAGGE